MPINVIFIPFRHCWSGKVIDRGKSVILKFFSGEKSRKSVAVSARRDIVAAGVVVSAIIMFVGSGGSFFRSIVSALAGLGGGPDKSLSIAVLLNIALILFGWRRYKDLSREVEERAAAEERAQVLALRDPLTGFHNRRSINDSGSDILVKTRARGKELAMVMLDLDHFKNVNDVHGHAVGDALLRAVASEIVKLMPPQALTARLGGDEFACAFPFDIANPDVVERVVEAIVARLAQPFDADGTFAHISVSAGIAHSGHDCETIDSLMRRSDIAMYAAKRAGRNQFAWFDASMERDLQVRNETESGMRAGIPKGEFVPYFEQQIDLTTGRLGGFEVLARWDHPTRGLVPPDLFIPVAEDTGMIADLSMSVIRQALEEARHWDPSLLISVNISPTQLKDPWLAQKMVKLLVETGFPATRLEIEITETSLFENLALAQSIIGSLKNQGIRLALDDFGTGYSSLAHLRALPFDRIKIDKSFVTSIIENTESAAIVNAITRLGDSLGLPVTAEGIEDAAIEERLRQLGCHKGQGWHFGRPASIAATRTLLAERNLLPAMRGKAAPMPEIADEADLGEGMRATG
jgi:diguanylate cyclase (GGDEF)-like protein